MKDAGPVAESAALQAALASLDATHERFVEDIVSLVQIPAPTFDEAARAQAFAKMLQAEGLEPEIDAVGNVTALRRGTGAEGGPVIVAAAHLDTVFTADTDLTVRRDGTLLRAPGIADDARGLAAILAFLRAMNAGGVATGHDILFVADVGEEGLGDLRGIRHLCTESRWKDRIAGFFTFDDIRTEDLTIRAIGSRRYRVVLRGPGGHSLNDFGRPNPAIALGTVLSGLGDISAPSTPRTTFCASTLAGGTTINSIPEEVSLGVDLRSEGMDELAKLDAQLRALVDAAVTRENARCGTEHGPITAELVTLGDRPAGATPESAPIVQSSIAAIRAEGFEPELTCSSTDANIPMSLGIPAVKFSHGGAGGQMHSLDEWIDVSPEMSLRGLRAGFRALVATAGEAS
ncbi:M20/M25/M40 family metallo-hydrolase [Tropicimonas sp. IMCC34011]|uniref:M20/M25/M40 family metallo-hydrolase n=1 Tax=Tropicimonas sp. IMCC34011 TaxID=2248759 RepID=UPI000E284532|nr:M20/M25/M40 family metallo-hydrolase [Tropicimonas sp. IMCC34011]